MRNHAFSLLFDDVESLCLVKECREFEQWYRVDFTFRLLTSDPEDSQSIIKEMVKVILKKDM